MLAASENSIVVPSPTSKAINRDIVTPHKISVLLLIKHQCHIRDDGGEDSITEDCSPAMQLKHSKRFCMVALKLVQTPDMDYDSLKTIINDSRPGMELCPTLLKEFFSVISNLLNLGIPVLLELMSETTKLIVNAGKGGCAKYSVLGLYIRRVLLSFDKLTFSQVVALLEDFQKYAAGKEKVDNEHPGRWTRKEAELFFAREFNNLLSEEPGPLQEKISCLLKHNPDIAEAHYLSFLNCLRCKELCGAKESLHQCFDRALSPPDKNGSGGGEERSFRYGTLYLAAMHVLFGHKEEATLALKEVIRLSHNAGDSVCLQQALSWLYHISAENRDMLIHRAMARCSDLELSYLMSLAIQAFTKYSGKTGGRPSAVFDVIMKSDVLNCQQILTELPANSYGLKSALWKLYGQTNLAALYSQQLLRLRVNLQPSVCLALCNISRFLADEGEYELAMGVLNETQELFPHQNTDWMVSYQEANYSHLINQFRLGEAEESVALLAPIRPRESAIRKVQLTHLIGDDVSAMAQVQELLRRCGDRWYSDPDQPPLKVKALVGAADCLEPGEALFHLLQALSLSQSYYLHYHMAFITLKTASVMLELNLVNRATRLVESMLPFVMSHGPVSSRGQALILLTHCRLADIEYPSRPAQLAQCIKFLTSAQDWLLKAQDFIRIKHCWYLKALIHDTLDQTVERNKCSFEFRQLEEIYPTPPCFFRSFY